MWTPTGQPAEDRLPDSQAAPLRRGYERGRRLQRCPRGGDPEHVEEQLWHLGGYGFVVARRHTEAAADERIASSLRHEDPYRQRGHRCAGAIAGAEERIG